MFSFRSSSASAVAIDASLTNWTPDKTWPLQVALAKARANNTAMKIAFDGDSLTAGSTGGTSDASSTFVSIPYRFYQELKAQGVPCRYDGFNPASATTAFAMDSRVTFATSAWALNSSYLATSPGNLTNKATLAPTDTSNAIDVYYVDSGTGTLRITPQGEADQDTTLVNSGTIKKITKTSAGVSAKTWDVVISSGFIVYIDIYDNTKKDVRVLNCGVPGSLGSGQNTSNPLNHLKFIQLLAANWVHSSYATNDSSGGAGSLSGFVTGIGAIKTALNGVSFLSFGVPNMNIGSITDAVLKTYQDAIYAAAGTTYPVFDMRKALGDTNAAIVASAMQTDGLHATSFCYDWWGRQRLAKRFLNGL